MLPDDQGDLVVAIRAVRVRIRSHINNVSSVKHPSSRRNQMNDTIGVARTLFRDDRDARGGREVAEGLYGERVNQCKVLLPFRAPAIVRNIPVTGPDQ